MFPYHLLLLCLGLLSAFLLFSKTTKLPDHATTKPTLKVSVVVPVRNEEKNIANLLNDLQRQTLPDFEVICVDDDSTDNTAAIIQQYNVSYIKINHKPSTWTGKTYACQTGAGAATGDVLIFVDADVRLSPQALERILPSQQQTVVSVQPYHLVSKPFEQFAFFFNAMGLAANGVFCRFSTRKAGLFGPIICISKTCFDSIGGFSKVSTSVIEDVALGQILQKRGIPIALYAGEPDISFKMYQSFQNLVAGFTKNYSSGAAQTPAPLFILCFLWIASLTATPILVIQGLMTPNLWHVGTGLLFYLFFSAHLLYVSKKTGSFKKIYIFAYPVLLLVFHFVFFYSLYAKLVTKKVNWKGRDISLEK